MAKVVGLSGPQGGGKSTLLRGLQELGYAVDDFKVSREVQKRLGWESLANAYSSPETMIEFQDMILSVKRDREIELLGREDPLILTERTFADIAVYTQIWTQKLLLQDKWEVEPAVIYNLKFLRESGELQYLYSGNLYLPAMDSVIWEDDVHRASKEDVGLFEEEATQFFDSWHPEDVPRFTVTKSTVEERVEEVNEWLMSL